MSVEIGPDGRRSVHAEVEVDGSPEEVWSAIATGVGISAWFVPTTIEERVGGKVLCNFGPGMDSESTIAEWEAPHRFVAESRDNMGPGDPTIATEWTVESLSGDRCVVRVVHSWFSDKEDWDEQFAGATSGWLSFFRVLDLYLERFRGLPGAPTQVMAVAPGGKEEAWATLMTATGLDGAEAGSRIATSGDAPIMAGEVAWAGQPAWPEELLLVIEKPGPGVAHIVPHPMGETTYCSFRFYFYGPDAEKTAQRATAEWQSWADAHFPAPVYNPSMS